MLKADGKGLSRFQRVPLGRAGVGLQVSCVRCWRFRLLFLGLQNRRSPFRWGSRFRMGDLLWEFCD